MSSADRATTETDTSEATVAPTEPTKVQARTGLQIIDSRSTSADDTAKRKSLPGKARIGSPSLHKKYAIPSKPSPPPAVSSTARARPRPRSFSFQTFSPRSNIKVASRSPPMARSSCTQTVSSPSHVARNVNGIGTFASAGEGKEGAGLVEAGIKPPMVQPRRKKQLPKSPGTTRALLPQKPKPPPVAECKKTAQPPPVAEGTNIAPPPKVPPRKKRRSRTRETVLESEAQTSGEGCSVTPTQLSISEDGKDEKQGRNGHEPRMPVALKVLGNTDSTTSIQGGTKETHAIVNSAIVARPNGYQVACDDTTPKNTQQLTPPRIPPRVPRRKTSTTTTQSAAADDTQTSSSPSALSSSPPQVILRSSPPSKTKVLFDQRKHIAGADASISSWSVSSRNLFSSTTSALSSSPPQVKPRSRLPSNTKVAPDSVDQSFVRRLTMHFKEQQGPVLLGPIPVAGPRRYTAPNRSKPKPPVPRPRSKPTSPRREPQTTPQTQTSSSNNPELEILAELDLSRTESRQGRESLDPPRTESRLEQESLDPSRTESRLGPKSRSLAMSSPNLSTLGGSRVHQRHTSKENTPEPKRWSSTSPSHSRALIKELQNNKKVLATREGVLGDFGSIPQRAMSLSVISEPRKSPDRDQNPPPKPLTRRRISSSASDLLDNSHTSVGGRVGLQKVTEETERTARKLNGSSGGGDGDGGGEKIQPEEERFGDRLGGAESRPTETPRPQEVGKYASFQGRQRRAASADDILNEASHYAHMFPIGASDVSSYTESEGRGSVLSAGTQALLERARQLSFNRKWCDQIEVKESGVLSHMNKEKLLLQEAIFEVITSEATYHLNLATLIDSFMDDPKMDPTSPDSDHVMDRTQHSTVFSNVKEIREVSTRFLEELFGLLSEDVFLRNIFPILEDYALNKFMCYERYCASQSHRVKELRECTESSEAFQRHLKKLEEEANQTLQSLVAAPMQRVTKLPLLMKEILKRTPHDDPGRGQLELTHNATEEVANLCNAGAGKIGDLMHLDTIWKKLHFGQLKPFLILSPGRRLKREGAIERLKLNKRRSRVMPDKVQNYLFAFSDLLIITTEDKDRHSVVDYCSLGKLSVEEIRTAPTPATLDSSSSSTSEDTYTMSGAEWTVAIAGEEHAFLVTLLESAAAAGSSSGKQGPSENSYIFVTRSETENRMWMEALKEKSAEEVVAAPPKTLSGRNLTMLRRIKKSKKKAPCKKLWWKQPQVEQSGVVKTLTQQELELQENMFEVLTSEEEHLSLLDTLIGHYMSDSSLDPSLPEERRVLSEEEYSDMFRNVHDVRDISAGLLKALQDRQKESVVVDSIADILLLTVERKFRGYIRYCTNLPNQLQQLDISLEQNEPFRGYLKQLQEDQPTLRSLLQAPMDRIRQLPKLMQRILKTTPHSGLNYNLVGATLRAVEKVERLCDSGQQKMIKFRELHSIESQLDFGQLKPISLVSVNRSVLKKGALTKLKLTQWFGKTVKKKQNYVIVLSDYLFITKRIENVYKIMDMSPLDRVLTEIVEPHADHNASFTGGEDALASARWAVSKVKEENAFLVTLPDLKKSYTFVSESDEDREQWINALTVQNLMSFEEEEDSTLTWDYFYMEAMRDSVAEECQGAEEMKMRKGDVVKVYRVTKEWCEGLRLRDLQWGKVPTHNMTVYAGKVGEGEEEGKERTCLVEVTHNFPGSEAGELSLEEGDVVKIARKMAGWYEGKNLRGNQWGWFPGNYTRTLNTKHDSNTS